MRLSRSLVLVAMLALPVAFATPAGADLTTGEERKLGREFALTARQRLAVVDAPDVTDYLNGIGQRIVQKLERADFTYQFTVVRDPRINAFAVPGGYVYVHSGLLVTAHSDDEVAGVLAHEIAHVHARHVARQQEKTQLLSYATLLGTLLTVIQPAAGALASAASQAVRLQYIREFEQEADYLGARYVRAAGYDPRGMLDFFKQLADQQRNATAAVPPYLQTHPLTDERLTNLEAALKTHQWSKGPHLPASFGLQRAQAVLRVRQEPPADVLTTYRRLRDARPGDPLAEYLLGIVSLETGQLEEAERALRTAHEMGRDEAQRELGALALRRRDAAEAREVLGAYLERHPGDASATLDLAKAHEALGDREAALTAYERAVTLAPGHEMAHRNYGLLAGRDGRTAPGFYHLATAARLAGSYESALQQYSRAAALLPAGDERRADAEQWIEALSAFLGVPSPSQAAASE
jgi:predicted Zn-dependent protease